METRTFNGTRYSLTATSYVLEGLYGIVSSITAEEYAQLRDEHYKPGEDVETVRREGDYFVVTDDVRLHHGEGAVRRRYYLPQ